MQTEAVWTRLPFVRTGQNHLAMVLKWGRRKGNRKGVGETTSRNDRPGVRKVPEGRGELRKMEEITVESCGEPATPAIKIYVKVKISKLVS